MRFDGENFVYPSRKTKFREEFCFLQRKISSSLLDSGKKKTLYQWGSLDFHRASLANLAEAMARTRKLCAIMLDTSGRVRLFSPLSFL